MGAVNKVVLNTGILYGRLLLTMGISLYSTRVVFNALGSKDFGIFNLLTGVIVLLSVLNTAMSTSTQRFLSFYQGHGDFVKLKSVFTNSLVLHIIIGLVIVSILEISGLFLFEHLLNIPLERIPSSKMIFHFMSVAVFFSIIVVPFTGSLIAHENMFWVALVSIIETFLKLGVAVLLSLIHWDKLIVFGLLTAGISIFGCLMNILFCLKKYAECTFKDIFPIDRKLFGELGIFAGWNLFGSVCGVTKDQGFAILLNIFFGTVINASYGIANQVSSQAVFFSSIALRTMNPQIVKSEGAGDRIRMLKIAMMSSKFSFFLMAAIAIPCIFEMDEILGFWLKEVPVHTAIFCQLILLSTLINHLTIGVQSAIQASGKIKMYQLVVGSILLCNIPISYILLKMKFPLYYPLISFSVLEILACYIRLIIVRNVAGLTILEFYNRVIAREIIPILTISLICFLSTKYLSNDFRFLWTGTISITFFLFSVYYIGLCKDERDIFIRMVVILRNKIADFKIMKTLVSR